MKNLKFKMSVLAFMIVSSSTVMAQSFTASYGFRETEKGAAITSTGLSVAFKATDTLRADFGISNLRDRDSFENNLRTEVGLTYSQDISKQLTGNLRVSSGIKMSSGKENVPYYNIEPSLTAKVGATPLSVRVGYRYRNAYDVSDKDRSDTKRLSVRYALSKKDSFALGYDEQTGSGASKQTSLSYTRSF